jgi:hypothetical protein
MLEPDGSGRYRQDLVFGISKVNRVAGNDIKAANETYVSFIGMLKWSSIAVAIITAGVVGLIASS